MPAPPRDWADPFLEQARENLRAAWSIPIDDAPATFCMLLQMTFEKLGKAAFTRSGQYAPRQHHVASHLFVVLLRHPAGVDLLTKFPNVQQFVFELETANPAVAGRDQPNIEYPWEDLATATVLYPLRDHHLVKRVSDPKDRITADALKFASALEKELQTIVP